MFFIANSVCLARLFFTALLLLLNFKMYFFQPEFPLVKDLSDLLILSNLSCLSSLPLLIS